MKIKSKKITMLLLVATMMLSLVGCSGDDSPSYTGIDLSTAGTGVYILSSKDGLAYTTLTAGQTADQEHWFLTEDQLSNIKELGAKDQLVFTDISSRPSSFTFYRYDEMGYTIGTDFQVITETTDLKSPVIITFGSVRNPFSPIGDYLNTYVTSSGENVKITEINGIEFKTSMLTSSGYLKGLTKDAMYKFTFYQGTYYKNITVKADSLLLYQSGKYSTSSYSEMESNYFIINLPAEMPNGYYYLEGYGLFKYTGEDSSLGEDDKVIE